MQLSAIILSPSRDASFYRAAYDAINFIAAERAPRHANASTSITGMIRRLLNRNICRHLARRCPALVSALESVRRGFSPIFSSAGLERRVIWFAAY